ncbi:MAG: cytochrome c oxidase subunit II [Alphaproteobacteria bacterium]|nr:cytochrome c oxidase subunit II [Alphaproteobacteria bacterium]
MPSRDAMLLVGGAAPAIGLPQPWQMGLQPAASPVMENITALNGYLTILCIGVVAAVLGLLLFIVWRFRARRNPNPATWSHNTRLEIAWTLIPVAILLAIAVPSFRLLYFENRVPEADLTLKVSGHQWYWSYEYPDLGIHFDAFLVPDSELKPGQPRLLTTDNPVVLPVGRTVRVLLSADDVIHSWSIPSLGLKTDSVPGRLNETWVRIIRPGLYYGNCAQLCGINHGFMPIMVQAMPPEAFANWVAEAHKKLAMN